MKLNLNASEQELKDEIDKEDKRNRYGLIFGGLGFLIIIGLIWGYIYSSNQRQEEVEALERQKMQILVSNGTKTGGNITTAWERKSGSSVVGYKAEYTFKIDGQTYKGEGYLRSNPQSMLGGFDRIWITYDPNNPTNNATSYDVENFKERPADSSASGFFDWVDPKFTIKLVVLLIFGLIFRGGWYLWNLGAKR